MTIQKLSTGVPPNRNPPKCAKPRSDRMNAKFRGAKTAWPRSPDRRTIKPAFPSDPLPSNSATAGWQVDLESGMREEKLYNHVRVQGEGGRGGVYLRQAASRDVVAVEAGAIVASSTPASRIKSASWLWLCTQDGTGRGCGYVRRTVLVVVVDARRRRLDAHDDDRRRARSWRG
jgi:hypothetical protein